MIRSGSLVRIEEGDASKVVVSGLSFATSVDFDAAGNAYVTVNGMGAPGSGKLVIYPGVAAAEGVLKATDAATAAEASEATDAAPAAPEAMPVTGGAPPDTAWLVVALGAVLLAVGLLVRRGLGLSRMRQE